MIQSEITQEQKHNLIDELVRVTADFVKDPAVECIYISGHNNPSKEVGDLELTVVYTPAGLLSNINRKIEHYDLYYGNKLFMEKLGVKLIVLGHDSLFYDRINVNDENLYDRQNANYLFNSHIIYDKNNKYSELLEYLSVAKDLNKLDWLKKEHDDRKVNSELIKPVRNKLLEKKISGSC